MVALNFPNSPAIGDTWPNPPVTGIPTYKWDGADWLSNFALGKPMVPLDGSTAMTGLLTLSGDPTAVLNAATKQYVDAGDASVRTATVIRSYLAGLTLSTAGSSTSFSMAPGVATDSTNAVMMTLAAAITKTTAAWAAGNGNGALDTGTIAANTWYHTHLIRRPDTGLVEPLVSLSLTAPTLPANYTQFRRIGSMRTNASSQWTKFWQEGDEFLWDTVIPDIVGVTLTATPTLFTLSGVPIGVKVWAKFWGDANAATGGFSAALVNAPDVPAIVIGAGSIGLGVGAGSTANVRGFGDYTIRTNTAAQIRAVAFSSLSLTFSASTYGWIDRRGRDA